MLERMTPYIWFFIVAVAFMVVGSLLQIKLPAQGALIVAEVVCMLGFALLIQRQWGKPGPMPWPVGGTVVPADVSPPASGALLEEPDRLGEGKPLERAALRHRIQLLDPPAPDLLR